MSASPSKRNGLVEFQKKLFNSRFFTVSILLHLIFILAFGGTVLFTQIAEPPDFTGDGDGGNFLSDTNSVEMPPDTMPIEQPPTFEVQPTNIQNNSPIDVITTSAPINPQFSLPQMMPQNLAPTSTDIAKIAPPPVSNKVLTADQARQIAAFTGNWVRGGKGGVGSNPRDMEFEFTAYLAKYGDPRDRTRGGDWASTNRIKDGKIVTGSLPNLLYFMNKKSRNRIKAHPNAVPLDLSSDEIFSKNPPFIFFTGHRDFVLSDREVENLRKYIMLGGAIWGDSSLPGRRSRFDIAFRREMRRIISDADKDWEVLPPTHPIYTKTPYFSNIKAPPSGINFYQEPLYALKYVDEIAILYTANDYGDMWQFGLTEKDEFDTGRDEKGMFVAINPTLWEWRNTYIRNISPASVVASYQFGTNIVIHLLTRWQDKVRNVPSGL